MTFKHAEFLTQKKYYSDYMMQITDFYLFMTFKGLIKSPKGHKDDL